jgi:hypothetical protein
MVAIGIRRSLLALMLAGGITAPAAAEVIYGFDETSYSPTMFGGSQQILDVSLVVAVSDSAAANGFSVFQNNFLSNHFTPLDLTGTGIDLIDIKVTAGTSAAGVGTIGISQNNFGPPPGCVPANGCFVPDWSVQLGGNLSGISVNIFYGGEFDTFELVANPSSGTGSFDTDNTLGACHYTGMCTFAGFMTVVPEPGSLGLLACGFLGLLAVRRRQRRLMLAPDQ